MRLRLTLLYGALFLVSGTALLATTYLLVAHRTGEIPFAGRAVRGDDAAPAPADVQDPAQVQHRVDERTTDVLHQLVTQSGVALAITTVVSVGLGWYTAGRVLRPLRTITAATRDISAGSLDRRLAMSGPADELKELGDTIDGLLARLESSFEAQRHFAANASHELRTPLTRARTLVEVALADPEPTVAALQHACERVLVASHQQERLIEALLMLARSERGVEHWETVDLTAVAGEALLGIRPRAQAAGITLSSDIGEARLRGDGSLVARLVDNLLENAVRHNIPGGHVTLSVTTGPVHTTLCVDNSGPLIADHDVDRLFRPFQRLAADRTARREGHGLGLAIVRAIAHSHGAELVAVPSQMGGLTVTVHFVA